MYINDELCTVYFNASVTRQKLPRGLCYSIEGVKLTSIETRALGELDIDSLPSETIAYIKAECEDNMGPVEAYFEIQDARENDYDHHTEYDHG